MPRPPPSKIPVFDVNRFAQWPFVLIELASRSSIQGAEPWNLPLLCTVTRVESFQQEGSTVKNVKESVRTFTSDVYPYDAIGVFSDTMTCLPWEGKQTAPDERSRQVVDLVEDLVATVAEVKDLTKTEFDKIAAGVRQYFIRAYAVHTGIVPNVFYLDGSSSGRRFVLDLKLNEKSGQDLGEKVVIADMFNPLEGSSSDQLRSVVLDELGQWETWGLFLRVSDGTTDFVAPTDVFVDNLGWRVDRGTGSISQIQVRLSDPMTLISTDDELSDDFSTSMFLLSVTQATSLYRQAMADERSRVGALDRFMENVAQIVTEQELKDVTGSVFQPTVADFMKRFVTVVDGAGNEQQYMVVLMQGVGLVDMTLAEILTKGSFMYDWCDDCQKLHPFSIR